ncbi:Zn-dependent hydrolase [Cytophagaceae bacterium ABcell3]|nr:Zn-dependent hydrolase [Cytophagaceae bacterium ABcell3]
MREKLRINSKRLWDNLYELSEIGKQKDGGIYRMAFSPADMEARDWLCQKIKKAGLENFQDGALNVYGKLPVQDSSIPSVITGSHIDTVPNAGALDGALGVIVALECLQVIKENNVAHKYPLELVAFSDEEGRFGPMFGSKSFIGDMTPGNLLESTDLKNNKLIDVLTNLGYDPNKALEAARDPKTIKYYLELHIEQGPVLDSTNKEVGVVSDITGLFKWQVTLSGSANHAGTTPMDMRNDAFMGLADFAHEIPRIIEENGSEHSRMTIGMVQLYPGSANTIPEKVRFSMDVRDVSEEVMHELKNASRKVLSAIARRKKLMFDFEEINWISPVSCEPVLKACIKEQAENLGLNYHIMPSGAAHDAQMVAKIAPAAMIFVPSKAGISHSMHEWTDWRDIEAGANLMLQTLLKLTE